ncbi:MAG: catalase [Lachnospiraceae bacterium]|nr:catalase [Lachnospiraceae bacterium]
MNAWKHFCTITNHKLLVMEGCFKVGLYWQGILHDLSKYAPTEFLVGCKYYKGYMSPNNAERNDKGYSSAWLHHKGKNKHHLEYWIDYGMGDEKGEGKAMTGMKMPVRYVVEMFIDRVSASKNYQKEKYKDDSALIYYRNGKGHYMLHEDTAALLEFLLEMLAVKGEKYTYAYIRHKVLKGKVPYHTKKLFLLKKRLHIEV